MSIAILTDEQIETLFREHDDLYAFCHAIAAAVLQSEQVQAWKRDAERYRWLRGHFRFAADSDCEIWFDGSLKNSPADQLDAAIDAAMEKQT